MRIMDKIKGFRVGKFPDRSLKEKFAHEEKELREHLTQKQVDKMVADSFPASDPPSTY